MFGCNEQLGVGRSHVAGGAREAEGANTDQIQLAGTIELKIAVDQQAIRCQLGDTGSQSHPTLKAIVRTSSGAQQGVRTVCHSSHASGAIAPGHGTETRAITAAGAPVRAEHQVVAVAQLGDAIGTHTITDAATHQRVGAAHNAAYAAAAAAPSDRTQRGTVTACRAPVSTSDEVITIAQLGDAIGTHTIACAATNQRVSAADDAGYPAAAAAPGHRSRIAVPINAAHDVVAIAQLTNKIGRNRITPHVVIGIAAHQRVCTAHLTAHPAEAVAPGHRTAESIPSTAHKHIVAIVQGQNLAAAHAVARCAAHQRVSTTHHAADASEAVAPSNSTKAARPRTV